MLKRIGLTAALLAVGIVPSFADDTCQAPPIPAVVDGTTATREQVVAGIAAVKEYIASSDKYQACIADYLKAQEAAAKAGNTKVDAAIIQAEGDKVTANQNSKQKVGDDMNTAIGAYKKAHPT